MKTTAAILIAVILFTVCAVPADGAPLADYLAYGAYALFAYWIIRKLGKVLNGEK